MAIWMPPAPVVQPAVIESIGNEIYADGGVIRFRDSLTETIIFRERSGRRHEVARIIMPRHAFDLSLTRAYIIAIAGQSH